MLGYGLGDRRRSIVGRIPGLTRWVQSHVAWAPGEPAARDGSASCGFGANPPGNDVTDAALEELLRNQPGRRPQPIATEVG